MKKLFITTVALLTFGNVNSQSREKGKIEIIPQIGYSSANYTGDEVGSGNKPLTTITFGVGADYFFNNRWSLRSGLFYQTMGTEIFDTNEELKYLTLPVNANWHFGSTRKWNLNFGPSIGFLTSAEYNGIDIKDEINSPQIGFNVGIGYKIEVSEKFSILIDYQSMSGITKIIDDFSIVNNFGSFNVGGVIKL